MESFEVPFEQSGRMLRKSLVIIDPNDRPSKDLQISTKGISSDDMSVKQENKLKESARQKIYSYGDEDRDGRVFRATTRNWLNGLSSEQIANLVVPDSRDEHFRRWLDMNVGDQVNETIEKKYKTEFEKWVEKDSLEADFSDKSRDALKEVVTQSLDSSPIFKWAVENYGFPVVTVQTRDAESKRLSTGVMKELIEAMTSKDNDKPSDLYQVATSNPFASEISFSPRAIIDQESLGEKGGLELIPTRGPSDGAQQIDSSISGHLRHEWGHFLHMSLLNDMEMMRKSAVRGSAHYDNIMRIAEKYKSQKSMIDVAPMAFGETLQSPRTTSMYSHANMLEMFAEGISAYTHPLMESGISAMNPVLVDDVEKILGKVGSDRPWEKMIKVDDEDELQQ